MVQRRSPLPYSSSSSSDDDRRRRRHRFDSPPKEAAVVASLHGLNEAPVNSLRAMRAAVGASEAVAQSLRAEQLKVAKELYVGNLPAGIAIQTLINRVNDALISMGATTMAGTPIVSGWLGGEGQFAFFEFRTVEECNNAMSLNGYVLDRCALKVGKPKGGGSNLMLGNSVVVGSSPFALDDSRASGIRRIVPIEESLRLEQLALVGAPVSATIEELEQTITRYGEIDGVSVHACKKIERNSLIFEFKNLSDQRKCAHEASKGVLSYDRDFPLALLRVDEAIQFGFINILDEKISHGLGRTSRAVPTRILWITGFPPIPFGNEPEFELELRNECQKFGKVYTLQLTRVDKDKITLDHGHSLPAESNELVAIVEFENVETANKCKKFLTGGACFYLNETQFNQKNFSFFDPNWQTCTKNEATVSQETFAAPRIHKGSVISAEAAIVAANKQKAKKPKIAPEDREIID